MAVRLDEHAVRDAVDPELFRAAEHLLGSVELGEIEEVGGGAAATVHIEPGPALEVWVGVSAGAFTGCCDCGSFMDDLCVHAVAVTLGAVRDGFVWSSAATPPPYADPRVRELAEVAAALPPRQLAMLVGELAAADSQVRIRLMSLMEYADS